MKTYVVDTYAWMEYFAGNARYKEYFENTYLKTPILVLSELSRSMVRKGMGIEQQNELLDFVKKKSYVVHMAEETMIYAGRLAEEEKIPLSDAIIYAIASPEAKLLTGDDHFKGKKYIEFVK